jgi:hypothetical protein
VNKIRELVVQIAQLGEAWQLQFVNILFLVLLTKPLYGDWCQSGPIRFVASSSASSDARDICIGLGARDRKEGFGLEAHADREEGGAVAEPNGGNRYRS